MYKGGHYRADLRSYKIAEPVEPLDVRLQVARLLHVLERCFYIGVFFGKRLHELLGADERQPLQFDMRQLLRQHQRTRADLSHVRLCQ